MPITLKHAHFSGDNIYLGPWISEGHWAIRKDRVLNAASFASLETFRAAFPKLTKLHYLKENLTDKLVPSTDLTVFTVTPWSVTQDKYQLSFLIADECWSLVQTRFLALTDARTLYAVGPNSVLTDALNLADRTFYVAPFPTGDQLDPLTALVHAIDREAMHDRLVGASHVA